MRETSPTILLVDDSAAIRAILKVYLASLDLQMVETDRAERALQAVRLTRVDLVIADFSMPGMDGLAFVRAVRSLPGPDQRSTPIILLTGAVDAELHGLALQAGADLFLNKPVECARLVTAVRRLLPALFPAARSA